MLRQNGKMAPFSPSVMGDILRSPSFLFPLEKDARMRRIVTFCSEKRPVNCQLEGLCGSLKSMLVMSAREALSTSEKRGKHLLLMPNEETLSYCREECQQWMPNCTWHTFLPTSSDKNLHNLEVLGRTQAVEALFSADSAWIFMVPASLESVVQKEGKVKRLRRSVERGDKLNRAAFCEEIEESGFIACEEVHDPGTYVLRSSRLDIFSYAHARPIRLTLWGDTVERLSFFSTEDQLSCEEIERVELLAHADFALPYSQEVSFMSLLPKGSCLWWWPQAETLGADKSALFQALSTHLHFYFGQSPVEATSKEPLRWESSAQPSFPDFFSVATHFQAQKEAGHQLFLAQTSTLQATRLQEVLREHTPDLVLPFVPALHAGFALPGDKILCYTDHELTGRTQLVPSHTQNKSSFSLKELQELQVGDYVVHIDHGIGRFVGLESVELDGKKMETVRLVYKDNDLLHLSVHSLYKLAKYRGKDGAIPSLNRLGGAAWSKKKHQIKRKIKEMAQELITLYARRRAAPGYAFPSDPIAEAALISSFLYEDTPDQAAATAAVIKDMEEPHPMDRLICGDVGFGKTEVAIRAALKAIRAGKQAVVLVPTTILALQHFRTFEKRLSPLKVRIDHLHRFRTAKEQAALRTAAQAGDVDVVIGTSALVSDSLIFKDLGLLIVDEEQKFGVRTKEKIKAKCTQLDVLTLSATPLPRTLHFSLIGVRDINIIATPPPKRQAIHTSLHRFDKQVLAEAIGMEIARQGQVFFVQNRIDRLEQTAGLLRHLFPELRIAIAHGQMPGHMLEESMYRFVEGGYDVLLSTNIIENGLDIPNANTIIIQDAHLFGLAELHQMRGRVGRSNKRAFCYLCTPITSSLSPQAVKRLAALETFVELGDGYRLALRDMDIRGTGSLLGAEQSGFMDEMGFESYQKVLNESLQELKDSENGSAEIRDVLAQQVIARPACTFEGDLEHSLPSDYVSDGLIRMALYRELSQVQNAQDLAEYEARLIDRFGALPEATAGLLEGAELRIHATNAAFTRVLLRKGHLRCFFNPEEKVFAQDDHLTRLLTFVQQHSAHCRLSEEKGQGCLHIFDVNALKNVILHLKSLTL